VADDAGDTGDLGVESCVIDPTAATAHVGRPAAALVETYTFTDADGLAYDSSTPGEAYDQDVLRRYGFEAEVVADGNNGVYAVFEGVSGYFTELGTAVEVDATIDAGGVLYVAAIDDSGAVWLFWGDPTSYQAVALSPSLPTPDDVAVFVTSADTVMIVVRDDDVAEYSLIAAH
jgi:hypothetical protein